MKYDGFYNLEQMRSYLKRSIIRLEKTPIIVNEVYEDRNRAGKLVKKLQYQEIGGYRDKHINVKNRRVNLSPVPLGFVTFNSGRDCMECAVVSRIPVRMWKIGLSINNLHITKIAGVRTQRADVVELFTSTALKDTIMGKFLSYQEVLRLIKFAPIYSTVSFHRHFAIQKRKDKNVLLYYKFPVVVGDANQYLPRLHNQFTFLQEHLNEAV